MKDPQRACSASPMSWPHPRCLSGLWWPCHFGEACMWCRKGFRIFVVSDSTWRSEKFGYTFTCIAFQHVSCHSIACIAQKQNLSSIDIGELMKIGIFPHSKRGKLIPKNPPGRIFRIKACSSGIVASKMDMYYCISI